MSRLGWQAVVIAMVLTACGGDGTADTAAGTEPSTTAAPASTEAGAPSLTLVADDVRGAEGQLLLALLRPTAAGGMTGSACVFVDRDPWSGSALFSTFHPDNPCGKDAPFGEPISVPGTYDVTIGAVTPGEQVPSLCATTTVTIDGPTELTITGADLSSDCAGF